MLLYGVDSKTMGWVGQDIYNILYALFIFLLFRAYFDAGFVI